MWVKNMHLGWAFRVGIISFPPKGGKEKRKEKKKITSLLFIPA